MKHDDSVYLQHILDAITKTETYLHGIDEAAFNQNSLIQDGVIRQIEIIGEATKQLSDELRSKHAHVVWQDIAEAVGQLAALLDGRTPPSTWPILSQI
jgi:uncharacterized protein with HEPN domain